MHMTKEQLLSIKGVGMVKAVQIMMCKGTCKTHIISKGKGFYPNIIFLQQLQIIIWNGCGI